MRTSISCLAAILIGCALRASAETLPPAPGGPERDTSHIKNIPAGGSIAVSIQIDASRSKGPLYPIWRFFGADEPNYATMRDGQKLMGELGEIGKANGFFRTHNLLCTGDGTPALKWGSTNAYTQDAVGHPIYDWTLLDHIFDAYLACGMRPYVQIGFMPKALSSKPDPYQHHWTPEAKYDAISTGWAYPPTDYAKWGELAYQWTRHCVEKYGVEEVNRWYWEVWNEANGASYWHGSAADFCKLHDYAIAGVRRALPTARVGGMDAAGSGGKYMTAFLEHCLHETNYATGEKGTPLDFVSFHAKGAPTFVDGHVRMGIANQLGTLDTGFSMIASYPELKGKPIIVGESDPDGCAACQGPQLGYRNGTMYSSYTAASFARHFDVADKNGVNLEGATTWAFEFENQPYFAGFRVLASQGIDLPVLNVFRMFSKMGGQRLAVESDGAIPLAELMKNGVRDKPDISALASLEGNQLCAMIWHYHDDDLPGPDAAVQVTLRGLPTGLATAKMQRFEIDQNHSNAFAAWKQMGSPRQLDPEQYAQLEKAGRLQTTGEPETIHPVDGEATVELTLPRQAVTLLTVTW